MVSPLISLILSNKLMLLLFVLMCLIEILVLQNCDQLIGREKRKKKLLNQLRGRHEEKVNQ